ncbi:MAG: hypothetical protein H8E28_15455 [Anaerolineae bacterium]|nr:hypothetical protein [Anaerolineae bacterium]
MSQSINKRIPLALHDGQHTAIISDELFLENQERRKARRSNPGTATRKRRIYPLKGVAKCWECWESLTEIVGLRGSTGGRNHYAFYRCGAYHDRSMNRKRKTVSAAQAALDRAGLHIHQSLDLQAWAACHHNLQEDVLMPKVEALIAQIVIPPDWHRGILTNIQHPDGILHFEAKVRAFKKQQSDLKRLYQMGEIDLAQLQIEGARLQGRIDGFWQTTLIETRPYEEWLIDFQILWQRLEPYEINNLLNLMFGGLFFDGQGRLRWILAHSPFDRLLGLPEGGMIMDVDAAELVLFHGMFQDSDT